MYGYYCSIQHSHIFGMSSHKVVKRLKTLNPKRRASPTLEDTEHELGHIPFEIKNIADFSGVSAQYAAEVVEKTCASPSNQKSSWEVIDHAVTAVVANMIDMMKDCRFDPFCQVEPDTKFALLTQEELAEHAKRSLAMQKAEMEVISAEFAVRNVYQRAGLKVKMHFKSPLKAEPPLCDADYHADFLRTPREDAPWERACVFGCKGQCEAQIISDSGKPLREFLLPEENQKLIYAVENELEWPFPDHPPVCLLCDRRQTHIAAARHTVEDPSHSFIDSEEDDDQPPLYSARGRPIIFNTHKVVHGQESGYRSRCLIRDPKGGKIPCLSGAALMYARSDYVVIDRTGIDGCIWFDQSRLLFPSASIVR